MNALSLVLRVGRPLDDLLVARRTVAGVLESVYAVRQRGRAAATRGPLGRGGWQGRGTAHASPEERRDQCQQTEDPARHGKKTKKKKKAFP